MQANYDNNKSTQKKALHEKEDLFRHLVESANAIPWEIDLTTGCFTYVGLQAVKLLGYPIKEWYRENFWADHIHTQDRDEVIRVCRESSRLLKDHELEYRMISMDGREIWIRDGVKVIKDNDGPVRLQGFMVDITGHKLAIDALAHQKAQFEAMFNAITDAVIFADVKRRMIMLNPAVRTIFGYTNEELIGQSTELLYADQSSFEYQGQNRYNFKTDGNYEPFECQYKRKNGTVFWSETLGTRVLDAKGHLIGFLGMVRDITERKNTDKMILDSQQELSAILNSLQDTYYKTDEQGRIIRVSPSIQNLLGYLPPELLGTQLSDLYMESQSSTRFLEQLQKHNGIVSNYEVQLLHKNGSCIWVSINAHFILNDEGDFLGVEGTYRDISQLKAAEDLRSRFGRVLDNSSNEIYVFDADKLNFIQVNRGARKNLGFTNKELEFMTPVDLKPDFTLDSFKEFIQPLLNGEKKQLVFQTHHQRKNGSLYPIEVRLQFSRQESPPVFLAIIQDISERIQNEQRLQYLAHHDALTTLPNRVLFTDRLDQSLSRAHWNNRAVAVLFLDLDHFKVINDTLGHDIGDCALRALSQRLRRCVREGDTVARLGGDEFAIVLEDIASADDVAPTARKILEVLSQPFQLNKNEFILTTSIGISLFPGDGKDSQSLLKHADVAMYRAKDEGRNIYQFYSSDMSVKAFERLNLEISLRRALERNEFVLYFQPQYNLIHKTIVGVEALLRWQHPDLGLISPMEFIPMLEETNLIIPVGEWVLRTACQLANTWNNNSMRSLRMSVNLSGKQTNSLYILSVVEKILDESRLDPELLEMEITESILIHDVKTSTQVLENLSDMGVRLAIDDFGTGYSSLSYLKRFPIDTLKIDKSFIHDLTQDPDAAVLVEAIIAMSRALKLNVVAEGVETSEQADILLSYKCNIIQGYLFSRPLPADEMTVLLKNNASVVGAISP